MPKKVIETLVEVAGIEPDTPCSKTLVNIKDSGLSIEALTEILTEISGADRQMLARIVQGWSSLSDELKRAVLRVVVHAWMMLIFSITLNYRILLIIFSPAIFGIVESFFDKSKSKEQVCTHFR